MYDSQAEQFKLKTYRSHKVVKAAKVTKVYSTSCVGVAPDDVSFTFNPTNKPVPQVGWYIVCYPDGYVSFSPPEAFDSGYTEV